jgi:transmembrane sensor
MSEKMQRLSSNSEIVAEACSWVAQLDSGNLTSADLVALREWMMRSPAHRREIYVIAQLNGQLNALADLGPYLEHLTAQDNELRKTYRPEWSAVKFAPLAMIFFLAVAAVIPLLPPQDEPVPVFYQAAVGDYRSIDLADGTVVKLNTDSQIEVMYAAESRRVRVVRGEALFDVAKDPDRPFLVYSGDMIVTAIGTSFVVRLRDAVTEIAVLEGTVAFTKATEGYAIGPDKNAGAAYKIAESGRAKVVLNKGQTLTSEALTGPVARLEPIPVTSLSVQDLQRKISWTRGLLDFSASRLEDVVHEVSRYTAVSIDISDPGLRDIQFGGVFRTGDIEALFEALESLGIEVVRVGPGHVVLRKSRPT